MNNESANVWRKLRADLVQGMAVTVRSRLFCFSLCNTTIYIYIYIYMRMYVCIKYAGL